jgi:ribonuclease BN (tRNA processing enzyme)
MSMRLTVIGCAGSFPGPASPASCYLVEADGFRLLIDLGNGALGVLQRHAGLFEIDAICLSHLHGDHCLDMASYWVARTYAPDGPKPRIGVYGPAGTAERLAGAQGRGIAREMPPAFSFATLTPGTSRIGPFDVTVDHVNHPVETFAFRIEQGGRGGGETPAGRWPTPPTRGSRQRSSGLPAAPTCCSARHPWPTCQLPRAPSRARRTCT